MFLLKENVKEKYEEFLEIIQRGKWSNRTPSSSKKKTSSLQILLFTYQLLIITLVLCHPCETGVDKFLFMHPA